MSTPAGWYPQPDGTQRYWDGEAWTEHVHTPEAVPAVPPAYGAPPPSSGSGVAKGCLIAGVIALVLAVLVAAAGVVLFTRVKDEIDKVAPTFPSSAPMPSASSDPFAPGPSEELPPGDEELVGDQIPVGEPFSIGNHTIKEGWSVKSGSIFGSLEGLELEAPADGSLVIDVTLLAGDQQVDTTICTVPSGETKATCLPLTEDMSSVDSAAFSSFF